MALSVTYTNFGGMLVSENRGGNERQYVRDPLGSLVAEIDTTEGETYKASYWPYGETESQSGSRQSDWGFVGLLGYLHDFASILYVRARHYLPNKARWLTVDPLWPQVSPYQYCRMSPTRHTDKTGLQAQTDYCPTDPTLIVIISKLSWDIITLPFTYTYGNCCGFNKKCDSTYETIDCMDNACAIHDECLLTAGDFILNQCECNTRLCEAAIDCINIGCRFARDKKACKEAAITIAKFYCSLALHCGGKPKPLPIPKPKRQKSG